MKCLAFNKSLSLLLVLLFGSLAWTGHLARAMQDDGTALSTAPANDDEALVVRSKKVVVLDPGHGGQDHGISLAPGLMEKDLDLSLALAVKKALGRDKDIVVVLTRDNDKYHDNLERTMVGNRKKADVFVSLHCMGNSLKAHTKNAVVVYVNRYLKDALLSHAVDENLTQGVRALPWALAQNGMLKKSRILAERLLTQWGRRDDNQEGGFYTLPLAVLDGIHAPAVLVELNVSAGFFDPQKRDQALDQVGEKLASGIMGFLY